MSVGGTKSGPWSFTTPDAPGTPTEPLRVAFGSCAGADEQPIFDVIASAAPDVFLFLGDNFYGDSTVLAAQRAWYRWAHGREFRSGLMASTPTLATWDDHDFAGDNTGGDANGKEGALAAFTESWPNPAFGTSETPGVFFRWRMGSVEFFVLDDRYWHGLEDSILGDAQTVWLIEALAESTATFRVVATGSAVTTESGSDAWAGFPTAREAFLEALRDAGVGGVVFLSGDLHRSELRLDAGVGGQAYPELISSPLANSTGSCGGGDDEVVACYDGGPSFILVDVDPTAADPTLAVTIVDAPGVTQGSWVIARSELE